MPLAAAAKWLIPLIIGLLGEKLLSGSEGKGGQALGALLELGGLASVGGKLGGLAGGGVGKLLGKKGARRAAVKALGKKGARAAKGTAVGTATTAASFAPFMLPMAMHMADQPDYDAMGMGGMEDIDPELMNALMQLMQAGGPPQQQMMPMGPPASGLVA